jgi:hypothetical protein
MGRLSKNEKYKLQKTNGCLNLKNFSKTSDQDGPDIFALTGQGVGGGEDNPNSNIYNNLLLSNSSSSSLMSTSININNSNDEDSLSSSVLSANGQNQLLFTLPRPTEELNVNWLGLLKRYYTILREALFKYDYNQRILLNNENSSSQKEVQTLGGGGGGDTDSAAVVAAQINSFDFKKQLIKSVNFHFNKSLTNVTPSTFRHESFARKTNQSCLILITLLKDKMLQLLQEQREVFEPMVERAKFLRENKITLYDGHNASKDTVLNSVKGMLAKHTKDYINLIQNIPGLIDCLDLNDLVILAEDNLICMFALKCTHLFIDNEFYLFHDGVQISKKWMDSILSYEMANKVFEFHARFNSLLLTDQEIALLMPILITSPCKLLKFFTFKMFK